MLFISIGFIVTGFALYVFLLAKKDSPLFTLYNRSDPLFASLFLLLSGIILLCQEQFGFLSVKENGSLLTLNLFEWNPQTGIYIAVFFIGLWTVGTFTGIGLRVYQRKTKPKKQNTIVIQKSENHQQGV